EEVRRRRLTGSRVFVVEFDPVERPPELADLLGYRFWVDDRPGKAPRTLGYPRLRDGDGRYYDLVNDLCHDLVTELHRLKNTPADAAAAPPDDTRLAVYLAEVTDDLEDARDEVKRHLVQAGLRVLPETEYPRDHGAYLTATEADLRQVKLFVQLLSGLAGKK